jgi:hypothetical protein
VSACQLGYCILPFSSDDRVNAIVMRKKSFVAESRQVSAKDNMGIKPGASQPPNQSDDESEVGYIGTETQQSAVYSCNLLGHTTEKFREKPPQCDLRVVTEVYSFRKLPGQFRIKNLCAESAASENRRHVPIPRIQVLSVYIGDDGQWICHEQDIRLQFRFPFIPGLPDHPIIGMLISFPAVTS